MLSMPQQNECSKFGMQQTKKRLKGMKNPLKRSVSEDFWSEWRGSNSRPPHPKCGALSTALHPDSYSIVVVQVVKSVVRHGFDRYFLFSIPPEIRTVEGFSAVFAFARCEHRLCSQTKHSTKLSYASKHSVIYYKLILTFCQ